MRTNPDVKRALERVVVLKSEGKSWGDIAQTLENDGLRDAKGKPFSADNLKAHYSKDMKTKRGTSQPPKELLTQHDERDERYADNNTAEDTPVETQMPGEWEEHIKAIAREVFTEMIQASHNMTNVMQVSIEGEEMPPEVQVIKRKKRGRKENRTYERLTIALDSVLAKRFKKEMRERGLSAGKLMDVILWNRYGKPKLSYDSEDN